MADAAHKGRTLIIGGGLLGVATLHALAKRGLKALLIERNDSLAGETSFANGGMLTPSMPDPWNSPGVGKHLFESLFDPRSAMKLRFCAIPSLTLWGLEFLRNSTAARHRATTFANYKLAAYSTKLTDVLMSETGLSFDYASRGTMKVFESEKAMAGPLALAETLGKQGLSFEALSGEGAVQIEPQLMNVRERIFGALYYPDDRSGDACKFTDALASLTKAMGAEIRLGVSARSIAIENGRIVGAYTDRGLIGADNVILCAGADAPRLCRPIGIRLPIAPAKGYSLTLDAAELGDAAPITPVIDDAMHAAVVPIGDRVRVVGTAEFTGHDTEISDERIENLFSLFARLYPHLAGQVKRDKGRPWAGLRPMSADGRPFIGPAPVEGLWFNCGHGHLGWTKAVGSARLLSDLMCGDEPEINGAPYAYQREIREAFQTRPIRADVVSL